MTTATHHVRGGRRESRLLDRSEPAWQPLSYFNVYRVLLAGLFMMLVSWGDTPHPLGEFDLGLFRATAAIYFLFSLVSAAACRWRTIAFETQVFVQVFVDIVAITLFMYSSSGVNSGFGMLLVVAVAGGSMLSRGAVALLFAAAAAIAVLVQQYYGWTQGLFANADYAHVSMLGAAFFATALLTYVSAKRIRASDALAAKREVDLANLAQLNEHIIRRMQSGILAIDAGGHIRLMNRSAQRLLGLPRTVSGERLNTALRGLAQLMQAWREDMTQSSHLFQPVGTQLTVVASFAAIGEDAADGVLVFLEDASTMTQRAQQLKLAGLGRLAAGISHEIRNPLSAITHAGQLLGESSNLDKADVRLIHMIRENAERMNGIIETVLQLGRSKPAAPESLELGEWLRSFIGEFVDGNAVADDVVRVSVVPADLRVRFDPSQLRQVLWNLCENGLRHADGNPALDLRAGLSEETRRPFLDIKDNGTGVPSGAEEQIFEPFYTTRTDGTGLGLYLARELCEGNQASLNLMPSERGGCFRITFAHPRRQDALPT